MVSTVTSPGDTPGMREACPREAGRWRSSFFPRLQAQSVHVQIVRVRGQGHALQPPEAAHVGHLPVDIALVLDFDLQLPPRFRRDFRRLRGDLGKRRLRLAQGHVQPSLFDKRACAFQFLAAAQHALVALARGQTGVVAALGEAEIGVVLPQHQPVFGARGHHAVGLVHALGDQIVHQHAQIAVVAGEQHGFAPGKPERGVDAGVDALRRGLFIARGAVHLPGEPQPRDLARSERAGEGGGVDAVVLDGVGQSHKARVFQPRHGAVKGALHLLRH